jgi:polyhydroxybutyrate depolymerase
MLRRIRLRSIVSIVTIAALGVSAAACSSGATSTASVAPTVTSASTVTSGSTGTTAPAATTTKVGSARFAPGRHVSSFTVAGVTRTAVVVVPASVAKPAPLVFVFHGHGGTGANIEHKFRIESLWPEAIVVYPNGLVGHKGKTDPAGVKTGWQTRAGEAGDRDLAFYDAMLATLRAQLPVDPHRIYVMGHSNGSAFVSLLLNERGSAIAATANLSGQPSAHDLATDPTRSMFMAMGMNDPIVPYANQQRAIPIAEKKLGADPASANVQGDLRIETAPGGLELDTYIYPGGHEPPAAVPPLIVAFFRRQTLPASGR